MSSPIDKPCRTCFKHSSRLTDGKQFTKVFRNKKRTHQVYFIVQVAPNDSTHPRLGLVVSRKVSKKAVERNRIKRIIRESFRYSQHKLGTSDYVMIAKTSAAAQENQVLRSDLDKFWAVAGRRTNT